MATIPKLFVHKGNRNSPLRLILILPLLFLMVGCEKKDTSAPRNNRQPVYYTIGQFCMGCDLSVVNQVEDHGGVFADSSVAGDPYSILHSHGANLVRLRLWHNPQWTKEVYGAEGHQLYNDLADVEKSMFRAKQNGMKVCLDFHYSDTWADEGAQEVPAAWAGITSLDVLKDSVYNYTFRVLSYLKNESLMPYMVQIGNEINCGMCYSGADADFPNLNACQGHWAELGGVLNSAINAVRDVSVGNTNEVLVALHIADPSNVEWWLDNITTTGGVSDYDIIGFSYYPLWHTGIKLSNISYVTGRVREKYGKQVMVFETAYPWTADANDNYTNLLGGQTPVSGYPFTQQGQLDFMKTLTQEVIDGGGIGVIYWEPAWITSQMKDLWGSGSSWENATFFDFSGNTLPVIDYMNYPYTFPGK